MLNLPAEICARVSRNKHLFLVTLATLLLTSGGLSVAQTISQGDVVAGVGNGQYNIYSNAGVFKGTITDSFGGGFTTGCAFTSNFAKLYTTNFSNDAVSIFDATGTAHPVLKTIDTSAAGNSNESLVFDASGNWYVGHADGAHGIIKYSPTDVPLATYYPSTEDRGTDWVDLAKDSKTLYYTSEGNHVKRLDVSSDTQLTDFSQPLPGDAAYAHRLLAPFDGSGGLLVADTQAIYRLDKTGAIVQTYSAPGAQIWFALNLDPNGTSFWSGDTGTGLMYRFNIASGAVELGPINTLATNGSGLNGICVRGEITSTVDTTPPVTVLNKIVSGPPKQVVLATHDTQSGLKSLKVISCANCTATSGTFTVGTNGTILTTATKTDPSKSSTIELQATDVAGNVSTFDPIDFEIQERGEQSSHSVFVSAKESLLLVANGTPGAKGMQVLVNHHRLLPITLHNDESKSIDLSRYMSPTIRNEVKVHVYGEPGAKTWIVLTQQ